MHKSKFDEKSRVVEILTQSFKDNKSVNYIVKQGSKKTQHIEALIGYSYDLCSEFGSVYVNKNKTACALILFPEKKKTTIKSILWDIRFVLKSIGISNIRKAIQRETIIKKQHPQHQFVYLWFIATEPSEQGKGVGTELMKLIIADAKQLNRPIYLETSTSKNIPWYESLGFKIYHELDFGYKLYCMRRE